MTKTTLLIMAAGIGSRFGTGIKQLEPVGLNDEIIMDYSIHDAIAAGFDKIVFIIRKDIEKDFKERIGDRIEKVAADKNVEVAYCFQDLENIPGKLPEGRTKPWGTGQAVLAARELVDTPFCVINADDYYGKEAFVKIHDYLISGEKAYCMAGFILKNTLSDNGGVTRGVCRVQGDMLVDVVETGNIIKTPSGAESEGRAIDPDSYVSMNFWGFPDTGYMEILRQGFEEFFRDTVPSNPLKAEYLLPIHIGQLLREGKVQVKVLKTGDKWFGVTYKEDKQAVVNSFKELISSGVYKEDLYSDL